MNKLVSSGNLEQNIEQKRDSVVGHVLKVGDGNATTAALSEVDVVKGALEPTTSRREGRIMDGSEKMRLGSKET